MRMSNSFAKVSFKGPEISRYSSIRRKNLNSARCSNRSSHAYVRSATTTSKLLMASPRTLVSSSVLMPVNRYGRSASRLHTTAVKFSFQKDVAIHSTKTACVAITKTASTTATFPSGARTQTANVRPLRPTLKTWLRQ